MGRTTYTNSTPAFVADPGSMTRNGGRQIDWRYVSDAYRSGAKTVQLNGAAAANATSITVDALPIALQIGQLLYFGQSQEFARVTAYAAAGATSVSVEALPQALEDNDTATVGGSGAKRILAGTVVAEMSGGLLVPRADRPGSETATGILATDAVEGDRSAALSGYGVYVGGVVYENLLPDSAGSTLNSTYKTELQTAGVGTGFAFLTWADDSGS